MINWMQKHKNYLLPTIFISTFAFVGAGFVGWGTVDFGNSGGTVANVGDVEVTQSELQREYSRMYQFYNQLSGGRFDQEQAEKMGLQQQAMQNLITQAMLQNYAHDNGLLVDDSEVAAKILTIEAFQKEGKFDRDIYERLLTQNRMTIAEFEDSIRKEVLLDKSRAITHMDLTDLEKEALGAAFYLQDRLMIKIMEADSITPEITEEELKAFWESNQNRYQTKKQYHITYLSESLDTQEPSDQMVEEHYADNKNTYRDDEGKILSLDDARQKVIMDLQAKLAEKEALKQYIALKKGENTQSQTIMIEEDSNDFGPDMISALEKIKAGDAIKPVRTKAGYVTAKLDAVTPRQAKTYEAAKSLAEADLIAQKRKELLSAKANEALQNGFVGEETGFVNRDDVGKIESLSQQEAATFLNQVFQSKAAKGVVNLDSKVVLYEVLEQQLLSPEQIDNNIQFITQNAEQLKQNLIERGLLKKLQQRYEVTN